MRKKRVSLITAALVAGAVVLAVASTSSAGGNPVASDSDGVAPSYYTPLGLGAKVTVVVQLGGDPVAVVEANAGHKLTGDEKKALRDSLKAGQDALSGAIAGAGGQILGQYQYAYNGIKVRISARDADKLAALNGVTGVHPLQLMKPDNIHGVPFIGAPAVWDGLSGLHGEGVKIAVIDTGIDYTHANFGGPGTAAAYTAAFATDALPANPLFFGPAAPRIKGGVDLVGDSYNADPSSPGYQPTPNPDPNPLDCNGHGSHVAGTAAGSGVTSGGSTYTGLYNAGTISSNSWTIGPGVAPKADLYAIRVFGCAGSTDVTVDAIEWAVSHDMDVINMSLGSPFGSADDPSAVASTNAAKDGVIVVASAGNSGLNPYIVGSPSVADGAISVAANDPTPTFPGVILKTFPPTGTPLSLTALNTNGFTYVGPISGPLVILKDNAATTVDTPGFIGSANESLGCSPAAYTFNGVIAGGGQIAVARRGTCARVAKAIFAQQAGAAVAVMTNNAAGLPPFEGAITSNPDTGIPFTVTIPYVGIAGNQATPSTDSGKLQASPAGTSATVLPTALVNPGFKGLASFSSGGPRPGDSVLKPDVTAPGVSISSTANGTGNGATILSGTSMAAPHTSGAAALTRQAHPTWKVADIKAAMVNTASPSLAESVATPYGIRTAGTGTIQVQRSTATQVVASANGSSKFDVAVSFGLEELNNDFSKTKSIKLRNLGSSPATFAVTDDRQQGSPHTTSFDSSTVTVPAHADAEVQLTLNVPAASAGRADGYREAAGLVTFTPSGADNNGVALRVPYYLVLRPRADVETKLSGKLSPGSTVIATVSNKNGGAVAGDGDFYAWGLEDKKDKGKVSNDLRAVGIQSFPVPSGTVPTRRLLVFAVNTWDPWSNAATNEFDIYVDVDGDGIDDYIVVGVDQGAVQTGTFNGLMGAFVFSTRSAGATLSFAPSLYTDGSTALLAVLSTSFCRAGEPCLNNATHPGSRITYHAVSFDLLNGGVDVGDGSASYYPWHESITTGGFADSVAPGASDSTNSVSIDPIEWALTPAKGLMIVTLDNRNGKDEAQLIEAKK